MRPARYLKAQTHTSRVMREERNGREQVGKTAPYLLNIANNTPLLSASALLNHARRNSADWETNNSAPAALAIGAASTNNRVLTLSRLNGAGITGLGHGGRAHNIVIIRTVAAARARRLVRVFGGSRVLAVPASRAVCLAVLAGGCVLAS